MKRALIIIAAMLPALLRDAVGIGGAGLVSYGMWTLHPAAGMIVGGALMVGTALMLSRGAV